jgi:hypothetical protein
MRMKKNTVASNTKTATAKKTPGIKPATPKQGL